VPLLIGLLAKNSIMDRRFLSSAMVEPKLLTPTSLILFPSKHKVNSPILSSSLRECEMKFAPISVRSLSEKSKVRYSKRTKSLIAEHKTLTPLSVTLFSPLIYDD